MALWTRKTVECCKWNLMGHPSRLLRQCAKGYVDCGDPAREVAEGNNISTRVKDHYCDILTKNVVAF